MPKSSEPIECALARAPMATRGAPGSSRARISLTGIFHVLALLFCRSRNQKYCKERAGRSGTKVYRGAFFDGPVVTQCRLCDKGASAPTLC